MEEDKKEKKEKKTPLKKLKTFFNKTSKRPNAYTTWGGKGKKKKNAKVHPMPAKRGKESLSEYEARKDHESVKDPKGKKGWRTAQMKELQ